MPADLFEPDLSGRSKELTGEPEADEAAEARWILLEDAQAMIVSGEIAGAMTSSGCSMRCCGGQPLADLGLEPQTVRTE